jgi:hypothetical protein
MNFILDERLENCIGKDTEEQIWFVLENSLEEVIYGHGRWGFWRSITQSLEIYSYSSLALSSNSKLQQNQDTNNLKLIKMKNINKSIIALLQ